MTRPAKLEAGVIGLVAARALAGSGAATVIASFERSFCLDVGGTPITIVENGLYDGPLNLRLATCLGTDLTTAFAIDRGERWMLSPDCLSRSDGLEIDLAKAAIWRPETPAATCDRSKIAEGLNHLHRLLQARQPPDEGLMRPALGMEARTSTERAAARHLQALKADLRHWLEDAANPDLTAPVQLLGFGPGLTPSGDDLLAGLLIAWRLIGAAAAADRLGKALLNAAGERTNDISRAHLRAAAEGFGAAPLHDLLGAIQGDDRQGFDETLDAAAKIGHSSGFDAIAGVMLALDAWLKADDPT